MLTSNEVTALTIFGTPLLSVLFVIVMWCRQGKERLNEGRILALAGNTFSVIPLACVFWNVMMGTYVSVLGARPAEAGTLAGTDRASSAVQGNETLLFLALFYAIIIMGNGIRREIWNCPKD